MKKVIFVLVILHGFLNSYSQNDCSKALTQLVNVEYYVEERDETYKLEHLEPRNGFILYTKDYNDDISFPFEENACTPSQIRNDLVLCPLDSSHEYIVGFEECIECNGILRFKYLFLYDGNAKNKRIVGELICR